MTMDHNPKIQIANQNILFAASEHVFQARLSSTELLLEQNAITPIGLPIGLPQNSPRKPMDSSPNVLSLTFTLRIPLNPLVLNESHRNPPTLRSTPHLTILVCEQVKFFLSCLRLATWGSLLEHVPKISSLMRNHPMDIEGSHENKKILIHDQRVTHSY